MKKILFSHLLLAKNKSALNGLKLTLASHLLYVSTEVANRAERVKSVGLVYDILVTIILTCSMVSMFRLCKGHFLFTPFLPA